jgi:hypothetical protein
VKRFVLFLLVFVGVCAYAQEFRATITGRVTDSTGAVIQNAQITVTNMATGVKASTRSDAVGQYTIPFLLPGTYSIAVEAPGFTRYARSGVTVQSGDKLGLDVPLKVGSQTQEVTVSADAPLLQTASSTSGQVLAPEEIANLPENGRAPLGLAKTEYGVIPKQKNSVIQARPFDNSAMSDFSVGGGASQSNEYLMNGVPNMQNSSRLPGFSPLQDSVAEVRVDVFQSDASYGDTSNGTINVITKAGGNQFHGALSEFNQISAMNAPLRWFAGTAKQYASRQNQYGAAVGGPVWIPKIFNGRNKLFFYYALEGFKGSTPNITVTTVPTAAERAGDFAGLLALGSSYKLYNPLTATMSGSSVVRTAIPNNCLGSAATAYSSSDCPTNAGLTLNPVAQAYLNYFPPANITGNSDGDSNYSASYPTIFNYTSNSGRIDYSLNQNNAFFFETHRSQYINTNNQYFPNISEGAITYTVHQGGVVDYIHTFSPRYTLDTRMGLTRTYTNGTLSSNGFDPTKLGFPSYIDQPGSPLAMPVVSFSESAHSFQQLSSLPSTQSAYDTISLFSAFTAVRGAHTGKLGIDFRQHKYSYLNIGGSSNAIVNGVNLTSGATSGTFAFGPNFMTAGTGAPNPTYGGTFASFLLGIPTSGSFNINPQPQYNSWYSAGFIQDDWRVSHSLTVNAGLRFESDSSIVESNNKANWFDPTQTNEVTAPAAAAYALHPFAELPASSFSAPGGLLFAGTNTSRRVEYFTPAMYFNPRLGLAFTPPMFHEKATVHLGYGLFFSPYNDYYTPQTYGYSSTMSYVATTNNYLSPAGSLSSPFPSTNPIVLPTGSSLGVNTYLGQSISIRAPKLKGPYNERWNLDVQYALSPNTMVQIGYIGSHSVHSTYTDAVSQDPQLPFLSRLPNFDSPTETNLKSSVTNPFKGLAGETGTLATSSTVSKFTLLQKYPEFNSVSQQLIPGASGLASELAVRVQKRTSQGLTVNFNYQWSHNLTTSQVNIGGPMVYGENASDFPTHVSVAASYLLPFGHGHVLLGHANNLVDNLVGGFTANIIYTYLSGAAIQWGGPGGSGQPYFANGTAWNSALQVRPRNFTAAVDKTLFASTSQQPDNYNYRTFPLYFGRQDPTNNLNASVLKDFHIREGLTLQYRCESYNVFNHTQFGAPNVTPSSSSLGTITSQANVPRVIQQGLRFVF